MKEKLKLYRYAISKGYNCPSPMNYPKRFEHFIKTHSIEYMEEEKLPILSFTIASIICFMTIYGLILF